MSQSIHRHTPTLAAVDPRRLPVRTIAYQRALADDIPLARVNRQAYATAGRLIAQWDPRLWLLAQTETSVPANQTAVHSLSGQVLSSTSVDAGWRVNLATESGQSLRGWDSRGTASRMEYDALMRPVSMFEQAQGESERCVERLHYSDASPQAAAHNLCGQLIRHDDPAGSLVVHEASLSGGLLQQSRRFLTLETAPDWPEAEPGRDELLEPGVGAVTHQQFSALGESLTHTDAKGHQRRFAYNLAGQLHGSWLKLAGQEEQKQVSAIGYNAFGKVETETAGNGVVSTACYSPVDGRLEQLLAHKAGGTRLQDLTYAYDPVGNILGIRDDAQPVRHFNNQRIDPVNTYQYDTLYQLIKATGRESAAPARGLALPGLQATPVDPNQLANYTQNYSYDAGGNLTTLCHVGAQSYTREMRVEAQSNRSVKKDEGDPATAFDANGNLRQLQPGQDLSWDPRNQLRHVTPVERAEAANDDEVYVYDGGGQRVRKIRRTQARNVTHRTEVRYLPGLELRTNTATGETLQVIGVSAGRTGVRVLHWETGRPDDLPNDQLRYSLSDHLDSCSLELDQLAQLISQEGYYPYGGTAWWAGCNATEAKYKTIRYSGKELDATGLYYYGFRYYAPWLQRWINPDPAGDIDGLNLFRMVRNNPSSLKDWMGLNSDGESNPRPPKRRIAHRPSGVPAKRSASGQQPTNNSIAIAPISSSRPSQVQGLNLAAQSGSLRPSIPGHSRNIGTIKQQVKNPPNSGRQAPLTRETFPGEKSNLRPPKEGVNIFFHYTNNWGESSIRRSWMLEPSNKDVSGRPGGRNFGRHYFTDLAPYPHPDSVSESSKEPPIKNTLKTISERIFGTRSHGNWQDKMSHVFVINTTGLDLIKDPENNNIYYLETRYSLPLKYNSVTGERVSRVMHAGPANGDFQALRQSLRKRTAVS